MGTFVEVLDQATFHDDADGQHHRYREQDRQGHRPVDDHVAGFPSKPVIDIWYVDLQRIAQEVGLCFVDDSMAKRDDPRQRHGTERADHEQSAMREVHDAQRPEDQCQAKRDQRIGRALVEPVQDLKNNGFHRSHPWYREQRPVRRTPRHRGA